MPAVNSTDQNARFIAGCLFLTLAAVISLKAIASYPFISLQSLSAQRGNVQIFDRYDHLVCTVHEEKDVEPLPLDRISIN